MNDFVFQSPTRFVFGKSAFDRLASELSRLGAKRALVVYGGGSVRRTGTLARVEQALDEAGITSVHLAGVRPNPEVNEVREGIRLARENASELIFAIGGGSVIDCAKAIAFGVPYDGDVWDFFSGKAQIEKCLPLASVLTIPAAGSEASSSCVISNDAEGAKRGVSSDAIRPLLAIMDPQVTYTLPAYQTAAGVTDMICHICERFFSGASQAPVTDAIACALVRSIMDAALKVMGDPLDYEGRATIMWAGTLAHNDLVSCGLSASPTVRAGGWESHALEHELSAHDTSITHGAGLAVILPAWMRFVWEEDPERFLAFGRGVFGIEPTTNTPQATQDAVIATIDSLQDFFCSIGMPLTLDEFGLKPQDVDALVCGLERTKGKSFGGFKTLTLEDARAIYLSALQDDNC